MSEELANYTQTFFIPGRPFTQVFTPVASVLTRNFINGSGITEVTLLRIETAEKMLVRGIRDTREHTRSSTIPHSVDHELYFFRSSDNWS